MAKKKRKTFSKKQLLSLFNNENYQKAISKIKQFEIADMSSEELQKIQMTSYQELAKSNFAAGDINRATRDIESLLAIDSSEDYKLTKLKYLCYMEHFENAIKFAQDLIVSKNIKIKKEAIFLFLLASIYSANYKIDEKYLKLLSLARRNYILAFRAFLQDDIEESLGFFEKCNPRARIEKENLNAIKSIILNQEYSNTEMIKPLYRFLLNGDNKNLQNTKNSRAIQKEITTKFSQSKSRDSLNNLIALSSSIAIDIITKEIKEKDIQARLIYNNIVLVAEKEKNYKKALEMFIKNRRNLVKFVESATLLMKIKSIEDDNKSNKIIIHFFMDYLEQHHQKLSRFQLDFIFVFLITELNADNSIRESIVEYGGEDVLFIVKDMPSIKGKVDPSSQAKFDKAIEKYSLVKDKSLDGILGLIMTLKEHMFNMDVEIMELMLGHLTIILTLLQNCQKPHKKYQPKILKILNDTANLMQKLNFALNIDLFNQLSQTIDHFVEIYNINREDLSPDMQTFLISTEKGNSKFKLLNLDDEDPFEILDNTDDDYKCITDENYLKNSKQNFIEALKNNKNPFDHIPEGLYFYFYSYTAIEFILELLDKSIEYDRFDNTFLANLFYSMDIEIEEKEYRDQLTISVKEYAKKDIKTALVLLYQCITYVKLKDRETLWYLKWLETYLYLVDDYGQPKDNIFRSIFSHIVRVQQKKRFKSFNARFGKLVDKFQDKGLF